MTADEEPVGTPSGRDRVAAGAAGGLAGGLVFGVLMQVTGMLPAVAELVGQQSLVVGWAVHMGIAGFVGATYAVIVGAFAGTLPISAVLGVFYGLVWWTLGGLTVLPLRLGVGLFELDTAAWEGLAGHIGYGLILGVTYAVVAHLLVRRAAGSGRRRAAKHRRRRAAATDEPAPVREETAPVLERRPVQSESLSAEPPVQSTQPASPRAGLAPLSPDARALLQRRARR